MRVIVTILLSLACKLMHLTHQLLTNPSIYNVLSMGLHYPVFPAAIKLMTIATL